MAWADNLKDAAYTSPSGTRLTFLYENVSREQGIRSTNFDFADADGTFVQDMGRTGRRYPLQLIMSGDNCDTDATAWEDALAERGQGTLEHPVYGSVLVVPTGSIRRRDDLVSAANQVIIEVEFMETNALIYPAPTADAAAESSWLDELASAAQAAGFSQGFIDSTVAELSELQAEYTSALNTVDEYLSPVAAGISKAQKAFAQIKSSINNGLTALVDNPLTLAYQTIQLIKTPARIVESVSARVQASTNQATNYLSGRVSSSTQAAQYSSTSSASSSTATVTRERATGRLTAYSNVITDVTATAPTTRAQLYNNDLFASSAATSLALSAVNTAFDRRKDAVAAAEQILDAMETLSEWRDAGYHSLGEIDDGSSWQATQQVMAYVAGILVDNSFSLLNERQLALSSDRSIIDLCFELYGDGDLYLDQFIADNNLSGDEIIEIPRGRVVTYYV